jgi:class 3 adenylate cyclase/alpha-beta hydrolase superfamily lysophospholipase
MANELDDRTRWARNGETDIAYRVLGDGPMEIVFLAGLISHIEVLLEEPGLQRWFDRLGRIARIILVDRRGTGMSGMPADDWQVEDEITDLIAVLDAVGSERAVLMAYAAGGPLALAFAAQRPERTLALVLYAAMASSIQDEDVTWAQTNEQREARLDAFVEAWGSGSNLEVMAPSAADDDRMRAWLGRLERQSMSPSSLRRIGRNLASFDVKHLIGAIRVPTLIVHRTGDRLIDLRHSHYLSDQIAGSRLVELPGVDSLPMVGDTEALLGEIETFLTGGRRGGELDRELLTVLFTDIVDATGTASRLGDARWRDLLAAHDAVIRNELERFGGVEVKTIGDSFLATFAGPPSQAVRCAQALLGAVHPLGIRVRCGLHTGECEHIGGDVGGMAVHIAARVAALAAADEVLVSGTTFGTVVGCGLQFDERGSRELRGVPGRWPIFALA